MAPNFLSKIQKRTASRPSVKEAADKLGISIPRIHQLIQEGKIQAHKIGCDYTIKESTLKTVQLYGKAGRPTKTKTEMNVLKGKKAA